jgi:regulator of RNase E activity RraA
MNYLNAEQIAELKTFDTPTVCNAIEKFNLRKKTEGFTSPLIRSIFPEREPLVGYACTAKISAATKASPQDEETLYRYYQSIKDCPAPAISVIQDTDAQCVGSFWGEVQTTIHKALGCMGTITNGGVRDLTEADEMGFTYFASCVLVSHAYIHMERTGTPVQIGGLTINSGDLLHADRHGVVLIPSEIAFEVAEACRLMQRAEGPVLNGCRSIADGTLDIEQLKVWRSEMAALRSGK